MRIIILQIYVEDKQLNDPDYKLNENDIGEFIETKLKDGSLIKIEVASAAVTNMDGIIYLSKFAIMRNAALTCASNSICLAGLAVASIGYIGYILYKDNLENDKVFNTASAGGSPEDPDDWNDEDKQDDQEKNINKDPYNEAINGGRHNGWVKQYIEKPSKEIEKAIKSFDKQIELHKNKIKNPKEYISDWDNLHPNRKEFLQNKKWPSDIKRHKELKSILQGILNNR